jgi:hypothetical protein
MTTHQTTRCMTVFRVGEVVSVEFPFTDMQGRKRRPGVVLASDAKDLLLARITTHEPRHPFDVPLQDWAAIGLPKPSTARHACRILGGSPARRPPSKSPPGDYDLMLRGVIIQRTVGGCQRPAGTSLSRRGKLTDRRTIKTRGPSAPLPDRLADRGAGGPRRSGQDRLDDGAVHVGEPEVVYGRSLPPSTRNSAHGRCTLRISRAAPPPAACRPGTTPPLRASPPREDSAPQDHLREHRELA